MRTLKWTRDPPSSAPNDAADGDHNAALFESAALVDSYHPLSGLHPSERALADRWLPSAGRMLDLGVGSGRTYPELRARSCDYVGVDYSPAMIEAARANFPDGRFVVADAADLSLFESASFDSVVFSYNGLDYLYPERRRERALAEIRRVLRPGGVLVLSGHNARAVVRRPPAGAISWPARARALAIATVGTVRTTAAMAPSPTFRRGWGYERDPVQGLLTHYSTSRRLADELNTAGFQAVDILAGDHPRHIRPLVTPWIYMAAIRPTDEPPLIQLLSDPRSIDEIVPEWDRLAQLDGTSAFQSRPWVQAWQTRLQPRAGIGVVVARDAGSARVVGLLPVARLARRLHHNVPLELPYVGLAGSGVGAGDHLGPLAESPEIGASLLHAMPRLFPGETIMLEHLRADWSRMAVATLGGTVVRSTATAANRRRPDDRFESSWSRKSAKNIRRRGRMLDELQVRAKWVAAGPSFDAALDELRRVHLRRWGARGDVGLFDDQRTRFLREFAARCVAPDVPWILLLERNDDVVAGLLGFCHRDTFSIYKTGWDPELARLGLGVALGAEAMRWAEGQGLVVVDYLRGSGAHKATLGCEVIHDHSVISAHGIRGHLLHLRERLSSDRAGGAASR